MKEAVCALIINEEGKVLAVSRKNNPNDFGLPGGKVEGDEFLQDAVVRETKEETGFDISVDTAVYSRTDDEYNCCTFLCKIIGGELKTEETGVVKWVEWETLFQGSFGQYNKQLRYALEGLNKFYELLK